MSSPESYERRAPFLQTNLQADSELILRVFIWPAFIGWMWRVTVLLLKSGDANFGLLFPPTSLSPLSLSSTVVLIPLLRLLFPPVCLSVLSVCLSYPPALCLLLLKAGSWCWQTTTYRSSRWPRPTRASTAARPAWRHAAKLILWTSPWWLTVSYSRGVFVGSGF